MGYYPQESLYKPYKYHGYTVRGTPNCPLFQRCFEKQKVTSLDFLQTRPFLIQKKSAWCQNNEYTSGCTTSCIVLELSLPWDCWSWLLLTKWKSNDLKGCWCCCLVITGGGGPFCTFGCIWLGRFWKIIGVWSVLFQPNNKGYCWWKKSCTTWDVKKTVNNGINYQPQLVSRISSINRISA